MTAPRQEPRRSEDRLKLLRELRTRVVEAIDESTCVRDLEPLARRLAAISAEIDELAGQREVTGSPADVIAARRAARAGRGETQAMVLRTSKAHG